MWVPRRSLSPQRQTPIQLLPESARPSPNNEHGSDATRSISPATSFHNLRLITSNPGGFCGLRDKTSKRGAENHPRGPEQAPGLSFARGIRSPAISPPQLRQGDEQQRRSDGVALQQWHGTGVYVTSNFEVSSSLLGPAGPSFQALSGRLKFTVRRHKFNNDSLFRWGWL